MLSIHEHSANPLLIKIKLQILAAGAPILATVAAGFTIGFSAIFLPQLQSSSSDIHLSNDEASWIASVAVFGLYNFYFYVFRL